jgi:hypothetical protein
MPRSPGRSGCGRAGWGVVTGVVLAAAHAGGHPAAAQAPGQVGPGAGAGVIASPTVTVTPAASADGIVRSGPAELEQLYRSAGPGQTPRGWVRGLPIVAPGSRFGPAASRAGRLVWQGKIFHDDGATAVNRFFGVRAVRGKVSHGPSWVDGRPSLLLDYRGTSLVYGRYRDEIREVAPGLYLGMMFARTRPRPTFTRFFAFEARP